MSKDDPNNPFDNTYHKEDEVGPHWGEPSGCCFGECETDFSVAFREYHGLTEAWAKYHEDMKKEAKYHWKKVCRRPYRKFGCQFTLDFCYPQLKSKHMLPRRLRWMFNISKNDPFYKGNKL